MTKEEAIKEVLKDYCDECVSFNKETRKCNRCTECDVVRALKSALKQEHCGDAISRQAVFGLCDMQDKYKIPYEYDDGDMHVKGYDEGRIINVTKLEKLAPVTPQPKTGHWEELGNYHFYNDGDIETTELRCSCCKEIVEWNIELPHKPHYCEECGTKMVGVNESKVEEENDSQ